MRYFLGRLGHRASLFVCFSCLLVTVHAAPPAQTTAVAPEPGSAAAESVPKRLWERDNFLADWGHVRTRLADRGITIGLVYTAEVFGNPVGGRRQGAVYDGLVEPSLDVDFGKLAGWKGLKFHVLGYYPHGASGTNKYVGDLGVFSNIEFYDSPRLFEIWLDQTFTLPGKLGELSVRLGQLGVDSEFGNAEAAVLFINSDFGFLPTLSFNMPLPGYAIAGPGARARWQLDERFYLQAGVFTGNPDPDTLGDPNPRFRRGTRYDRHGVRFDLNADHGAFTIAEAAWLPNHQKDATGLPGAYRIGAFYHSATFSDLRRDNLGRSLADSASTGIARAREGDYGGYAVAEQTVWRKTSSSAAPTSGAVGGSPEATDTPPNANAPTPPPAGTALTLFARIGFAPDDRNTAPFYADTGLALRGPFSRRPRDIFGIAFAYAGLSDTSRALARDRNRFDGTRVPLPDYEAVLEITYQFNFAPWLQVQPDLQYIFHPGGAGVFDDALVLGLRSVVTF